MDQLGRGNRLEAQCEALSVTLGDIHRNGLLKATDGKYNHEHNKEQGDVEPAAEEVPTNVGSAGRLWPNKGEPRENVHVDGGKTEVLSQGERSQGSRENLEWKNKRQNVP